MKLLTLLLCGVLAAAGCAQKTPPDSYETLLAAAALVVPDENAATSAPRRNLSQQEDLARKRAAVARNAPALEMVRSALKTPIEVPPPKNPTDLGIASRAAFRKLARLLSDESDVRLADGDAVGALDSRLTALELSAATTRTTSYLGFLSGIAQERLARREIERVAAKLDAPQIRAALPRLKAIEARRETFAQIIQADKKDTLNFTLSILKNLATPKERASIETAKGRAAIGMSEAEARETLAGKPETTIGQMSAVFDAALRRAQLPYLRALKTEIAPAPRRFAARSTDLWRGPTPRFFYERNVTENRLLHAALELCALKLESGAYPPTFAAPIDPFSDNQPLIYKRDGDKYQLYSVGPDGKDNNAAPIQTTEINRQAGAQTLSQRLSEKSTGDILAPVFYRPAHRRTQ